VDLIGMLDWGTSEQILDAKKETKATLEKAIKTIEAMKDFDGKDEYKKEMLKLLSMYEDILKNEISEMIDYITYHDELTDEDRTYIDNLSNRMLDKYEEGHDKFAKYQEAFAKEWDFTLI